MLPTTNRKHLPRRRSARALGLALVALVATGCIDDPTLVDDDPIPLSVEEAEILGLQVWRQIFEASLSAAEDPEQSTGPAAAPVSFAESADTTVACDLGGSVDYGLAISGTGDDETGEIELTLSITQTHHACVVQDGETSFTLDGSPDVTATFTFGLDAEQTITLTGSLEGRIRASAGGHSGLCAVDIAFGGQQDSAGVGSYTVQGTMCGAAVMESVSVG